MTLHCLKVPIFACILGQWKISKLQKIAQYHAFLLNIPSTTVILNIIMTRSAVWQFYSLQFLPNFRAYILLSNFIRGNILKMNFQLKDVASNELEKNELVQLLGWIQAYPYLCNSLFYEIIDFFFNFGHSYRSNKFSKIDLLFIRINNKTNSNNILVYIKNNILVNIKANILVEKICWEHHY